MSTEVEIARARVFQALHEIAVALGGVLEPGELANLVVDRARDLLSAGAVGLYLYDEASQSLRPIHSSDAREGAPEPSIAPGTGAAGMAFLRGEPVLGRRLCTLAACWRLGRVGRRHLGHGRAAAGCRSTHRRDVGAHLHAAPLDRRRCADADAAGGAGRAGGRSLATVRAHARRAGPGRSRDHPARRGAGRRLARPGWSAWRASDCTPS